MANESIANEGQASAVKVFEARADDPDEVSDKLSIAAAMWARGDRADALTWLRRAAESASDAELDLRALELAKAASELAAQLEARTPVPAPAAPAPAAPSHKPKTAPPARPTPTVKPPPTRPPGSKLPPLPPLRTLGTAPSPAPKGGRIPSIVTSTTGLAAASGTVDREPVAPAPARPSAAPTRPMPWDELERERESSVVAAEPAADLETTATYEAVEARSTRGPESDGGRVTHVSRPLPLAIGMRVRLLARDGAVIVVPEGESPKGVAAIVVPANPDDDLRAVFARARE